MLNYLTFNSVLPKYFYRLTNRLTCETDHVEQQSAQLHDRWYQYIMLVDYRATLKYVYPNARRHILHNLFYSIVLYIFPFNTNSNLCTVQIIEYCRLQFLNSSLMSILFPVRPQFLFNCWHNIWNFILNLST